jgi:hypothetical protein
MPATSTGSFQCARCGHSQSAELSKGGNRGFLLQFATCPSCKLRSRLGAYVQRNALLYIGFCAIIFLTSRSHPRVVHPSTQLIIDAVLFALILPAAIRVWRTLDRRVHWLEAD